MNFKDIFVSVVIPCRNSAEQIQTACRAVLNVLKANYTYFEVVVVDDGSIDLTSIHMDPLLKEFSSLRYIRLARQHGVDIAISAGLDSAIGDYVVVLDPLIDPPAMIPEIVARCQKNPGIHYGVVDKPVMSFHILRGILSKLFDWYCKRFLHVDIQRKSMVFRVFSRQAVNLFTQMKDRVRLLRLLSANLGLPTLKFTYTPLGRQGLVPPRTLSDDIDFAFDILVSTSRHPLRFVSRVGILLAAGNVFYAIYILMILLFKSHVAEGWATLSMQSAVMFFFLFAVLTILGEYVGKLVFEGQHRSLYTILEERTSSVLINEESRRNIVAVSTHENSL